MAWPRWQALAGRKQECTRESTSHWQWFHQRAHTAFACMRFWHEEIYIISLSLLQALKYMEYTQMLKNDHQNKQIRKAEKQINHHKRKPQSQTDSSPAAVRPSFHNSGQGHPPASGGTGVPPPTWYTTGGFCLYNKGSAFLHPRR